MLHPGRVAVLFEGSERAVAAQLATAQALVGATESDVSVWDESRRRQAAAKGRVRFDPGDLAEVVQTLSEAVIRPSSGVAFAAEESASIDQSQGGWQHLVARLAAELDPRGVLAA